MIPTLNQHKRCPCNSGGQYGACCRSYHSGKHPETALALMRSRYAAYALDFVDYIMETTHRENPGFESDHDKWQRELHEFCTETKFSGLEILEFVDGESSAVVAFRAHMKQQGEDVSFTERSSFVKQDGRWLYRSGEVQEEK